MNSSEILTNSATFGKKVGKHFRDFQTWKLSLENGWDPSPLLGGISFFFKNLQQTNEIEQHNQENGNFVS